MMNIIYNRFGDINVLVNNAGVAQQKLFTDISRGDWDWMFNVNIKGMFNCCQAVLPKMINNGGKNNKYFVNMGINRFLV